MKKQGFTLVELMIVVAIIGILAAIAVPNFIRFQARSKQSEAKTNLKAIFVGQRTRFAESEAYSVRAGEIGFSPERGNRYAYDLGSTVIASKSDLTHQCAVMQDRSAAAPVSSGEQCGVLADVFRYQTNIVPTNLSGRSPVVFSETTTGTPALAADSVGVTSASCPRCEFAARAVGNIDNDPGADEAFVSSQFASNVGFICSESYTGLPPGAMLQARDDVNCD